MGNIRNQIKRCFFAFSSMLVVTNSVHARIHEFETTHLKSMGGTGVASVLMEEAAFLNPASLAFFNLGSVYFQRDRLEIKNSTGEVIQKPKTTGVVVSDGNSSLSGSLSYTHQVEKNLKRSRFAFAASSPLSKESAFGVSLRKTKDEDTLALTTKEYYQSVFGITHALNEQTSLGIVAYDPFNASGGERKAMIGVQHNFIDYISVALDAGGDYSADEISKALFYRGGVQIKVLNDFLLRFGAFNDKAHEEKGNGFGLAWIQPRLALEFALKNIKQSANLSQNRAETKTRETSFSLSLRF